MIASDWVVGFSVVVGEQGPLVGGADLPVPPDRGGQGEQPLGDPDIDTGQGASPVAFQPKLVFEGVEGALDPLPPATQRAQPMRLVSTVGTHQDGAVGGDQLLELPAGEALVAQDEQPWPQPGALVVQHGGDHLALAEFGVARHQATGTPSGVASTYRRKPQNQRWWLLQ
jgi:hypothetical protein